MHSQNLSACLCIMPYFFSLDNFTLLWANNQMNKTLTSEKKKASLGTN